MASDEKPTSIWKKEMSFRRKPADESAPASDSPAAESGAGAPAGSVWKKEISLRKKPKEEPAEPEVVAVEPEPVAPEPEPEPAVELEPVAAAPEPVLEETPAVEHSWLTKPLEEISEPPAEPLDAPTLVPFPVSLVPDAPAPFVEAVAAPAYEPEPESEPELDLDLDLALPVMADAAPDPAELPALPEFPVAAALPDLPLPPVLDAAPTVEAQAEAEPRVPFYKRDLSRKRTPREDKPKAEKAPRLKRERAVKVEADDPAGDEKVPFYKKSLSLRRGPKEWDAAEPVSEPKQKSAGLPKLRRPAGISLPSLPRGGAKKIVGLKIGGSQIAAACVTNGASPELLQAVRMPLEQGIVVGGELRDPEALAVALREFFQRNKLPKRGVRLGIANNRIGVRTFEVTGIDDPKQLANAIRFRAQEVLPIPLEEAVLDYQVLSTSVNEEGQPVSRVLLVVAYRELVDRYVYACRKAGLQIVGIDLEAFALLRAIAEPHDPVPGSERGALVAVSVGHDRSTFAVSDGRVCEFTRVLEWGGWALNIAIARALDTSPSEAEPIKRALSFAGSVEVPEGFNVEHLDTAREAARRQLQTFARELVSSLQFYQNQPGSLSIGEIVLTGGTAHLPGLGAELERLIGVPVRVADPLTRLKVSKKAAEHEQVGSLAVAIGLGIED
ncbi:MAG TPA: type IV pilus assembly protein PilM [Gaiellaceae bacterium]|nr:type IV pilus assembly protein PilM [Gaiellaceae bacterium]